MPDDNPRRLDRRTLLRSGAGAAAAAATLPALMGTAAAHFPEKLDAEILPRNENNQLDTDSSSFVSVLVRPNEVHDPQGNFQGSADNAAHYRFGYMAEGGHGVRPRFSYRGRTLGLEPGSLVLFFPLSGAGFPDGTSTATLKWEREKGGHHGYSDRGTLRLTGSRDRDAPNPDVDVLNYALTLEHLEYAFYRDGLEAFSDAELRNAGPVADTGERVRQELPGRLATIRDHEGGHVDALTAFVERLGGDPVGEADYTFEYDSAATFLETARTLENTGVAAYKGAAPSVVSNDVLGPALGIHSVEARHAAFLNELTGKSPFPDAVDAPLAPGEVTEAANPFFEADIAGSVGSLSEGEPTVARKAANATDDVAVLNYALTLEHLEYAFYRDGLEAFSDAAIRDADVLSGLGDDLRRTVPDRLRAIRDHEQAHVDSISQTVGDLGGTPVEEAEYTFAYESPTSFLGTAQVLENTGVAAYAGAAPTVSSDAVFGAAAGIHSVEARHAGFLNQLNGGSPYPDAVDAAMTMGEVLEAAGGFIAEPEDSG
jgi:rubrerythrin